MKTKAKRNASLSMSFDFASKASAKKSMNAYGREIDAGMLREHIRLEDLAYAAGVAVGTIINHRKAHVLNPQIRTVFSILFALGWSEITISKDGVAHSQSRRTG